MNFLKYVFIVLGLLSCVTKPCGAQDKVHQKRIFFLQTLNPDKLAYRLTRNLHSDSEKVRVIHDWIASHVKYDVKKWLSYDYRQSSLKRILWRRKAICLGYAELFEKMCNSAGVACVTVPGYNKDITTNVNDHFYFDEHIWNAVYIYGQWKLVDVCWDAGGIRMTHRTFKGFFVHLFSGGKKDIVKYKPRFVKEANEFYFLKSGNYFATDHLALNPVWQLTSPQKTIGRFEQDSAYYYKKYPVPDTGWENRSAHEQERRTYLNTGYIDRAIQNGFAGYSFNHRNNFDIAVSYYYISEEMLPHLDAAFIDTAAMIMYCDSLLFSANKGISHTDSVTKLVQKQKTDLFANCQKKKDILTKQNAHLINSTRNIVLELSKGMSLAWANSNNLNNTINKRKRLLKNSEKGAKTLFRKGSNKASPKDSLHYTRLLEILSDSILAVHQKLQDIFNVTDTASDFIVKRMSKYSDQEAFIASLTNYIIALRYDCFDDLDYEIRKPKDSLIGIKDKNDSLVYLHKKMLFAALFDRFRIIKTQTDLEERLFADELTTLKKLRAACITNTTAATLYDKVLSDMQNEFTSLNEAETKYKESLRDMHDYLKMQLKITHAELQGYQDEKNCEQKFFGIRRSFITNHAKGLLKVTKDLRKALNENKKITTKYKQKLKKKKESKTNSGPNNGIIVK